MDGHAAATERAIPAMTLPTWAASPSSASPSSKGVMPAALATAAAASSDRCGVAIITFSTPASRGSPGLGVSSRASRQVAADRLRRFDAGSAASTARASAKVLGSAMVGPDAIAAGSSPGTSEISRLTTLAGCAAAASLPPLIAER